MAFPSLSSRASVRLPSPHRPRVEQISPNKFMISRCTTAAFTLSRVPLDFVVMCQLAQGLEQPPVAFDRLRDLQRGHRRQYLVAKLVNTGTPKSRSMASMFSS